MFSPPNTPLKVISILVIALVVWAYLIRQVRGQWRQRRQKREVIAEAGLQQGGRRPDRRTLLTAILIGGVLLVAGFGVYVEQSGTPLAQARLVEVEAWVHVLMKYLMIGAITLFVVFCGLLWWSRDPAIKAAAKLALAGRHGEAEAGIRAVIEAKGPNEQRLTVLGLLLMEQNRLEESLQHLQEARRLAKRPAAAKNNCALVLWKLGRREEAARLFDEVCDQDPNNLAAVSNSCLILAELGDEIRARQRLQQAEHIFARYDFQYTKTWVPLLDECRKAAPPAQGFPVVIPGPSSGEKIILEDVSTLDPPIRRKGEGRAAGPLKRP